MILTGQAGRPYQSPDGSRVSVMRPMTAPRRRAHPGAVETKQTSVSSRRWDAWAPWLIIFGPVAGGLGWIAGIAILWTSPTWSQRDKLIATVVSPAGLVALFFGLTAALSAAAGCPEHAAAGCTTRGVTLPLGAAILLAVAGLAAHVLPPLHLMRKRRRQRFTLTRSAP